MKLKLLAGVLATASVFSAAQAQLTAIGPFTGMYNETFESFSDYGITGGVNSLNVMGGIGSIVSNVPGGANQLFVCSPTAGFGLGANGGAVPNSGSQFLGLFQANNPNGLVPVDATLVFNTAIQSFGGYFAMNDSVVDENFTMTFFDIHNHLIGTSTNLYHSGNAMQWAGYSSTVAIGSVEFSGGNFAPVMDDLQASPQAVPEPMSILALGIGALGLLRRRKN